jgi:nickel/cobalt transporter (NiCoT) family protein
MTADITADITQAGFLTTCVLAGLLGFRHGFDADHIAVVDGMTRARQLHRNYWTARLVGLQFAAGHSATILVAALLLFGQGAALPSWLDGLGVVISTVLLLVIASSNLAHALSPATAGVRPLGPVAALLFRITGRELHPALVGVAFAMSLDSLAQAAFFASHGGSGGATGGIAAVALLAAAFGAGMMLADAGNGLLLAWFAQRSDRLARQASRFSSGFIAVVALATVAAMLLRQTQTGFAQAWEQAGVWTGVGLVVLTSAAYTLRLLLQRARGAAAAR